MRAITLLSVPAVLIAHGGQRRAPESDASPQFQFTTIDPPFGTVGVNMDVQSFYVATSGIRSVQYQIPGSGVCCGSSPDFFANVHTAVWRGGSWQNIDVPGAPYTGATAPNNQGQVGLTYPGADGAFHSAIDDPQLGLMAVPNLAAYPGGLEAVGLNDRGRIAAYAFDAAGHIHGFFGDAGHYDILDFPGATDTLAQYESNSGVAVGAYLLPDGSLHGFAHAGGQFTTVDVPGSYGTIALAANGAGAIVGGYFDASGTVVGFVTSGGGYFDVRVPGSTLTTPWMINDRGEISGTYATGSDPLFHGTYHGFLATPLRR